MTIKDKIKNLSKNHLEEIIEIRRHLHANPELSFEEFKTSEYICSILDKWNVSYQKGFVKTGILAIIDTKRPGKTIALRADMDALPIQEKNDLSFKSKNHNVMHACGHDVHSASLLGVIKILNEIKDELNGKILFIFQPGEEKIPGGAKQMIEAGIFKDNEPDLVIAQHVCPNMPAGEVGFRQGQYMASSDEIYITVKGKGGHAALPESLIDPVLMAGQLLVSLQQIVSRNNKPGLPTVLSFGNIIANGAVNVIPDEVKLEGTFRTMNEDWRKKAHELIKKISEQTTAAFGGSAEIEIRKGYPVLFNDPEFTDTASQLAVEYLGNDKVKALDIRMTAEDFAYFSQKYHSFLYRLGTAESGVASTALHTSGFKVNEDALEYGMGLMSWISFKLQ
ncbi:MAG: amidohydrolase [Bacteroidales bacterium]|nr:amidohydrolase [Bacteroidales bacterium]MCF8389827.1 amidohydrolase [Bacteroidales bacterium]